MQAVARVFAVFVATVLILLLPACGSDEEQQGLIGQHQAGEAAAFGLLPAPNVLQGESGGFGGHRSGPAGNISYSLAQTVSLPESGLAYRLETAPVSQELVTELARLLDMPGTVEPLISTSGVVEGYGTAVIKGCGPAPPDEPDEGTYYEEHYCEFFQRLSVRSDGSFALLNRSSRASASPPTVEQAEDAARSWLGLTGLVSTDPFMLSVQAPLFLSRKPAPVAVGDARALQEVIIEPANPVSQILDHPRLVVAVNGDGTIYESGGYWASIEAPAAYTLLSVEQFLRNLRELRGTLDDMRFIGSPEGELDWSRDVDAKIIGVEIAYTRAIPATGQAFLVPVFLVHCEAAQGGTVGPLRFTTWIPATESAQSPPVAQPRSGVS